MPNNEMSKPHDSNTRRNRVTAFLYMLIGKTQHPEDTQLDRSGPEMEMDTALDLLKRKRRRILLEKLDDGCQYVNVNELAQAIAAEENDLPREELNTQQVERVRVSLYQSHLPRLSDKDAVDWNEETQTVSPGIYFAHLRETQRTVQRLHPESTP